MPLGPMLRTDRAPGAAAGSIRDLRAAGRGRFRAVRRRYERGKLAAACAAAIVFGFGAPVAIEAVSPWPAGTTVRHLLSAATCDTARLAGLAPSLRGSPGYWEHHDRDGDGIACEPWRRSWSRPAWARRDWLPADR